MLVASTTLRAPATHQSRIMYEQHPSTGYTMQSCCLGSILGGTTAHQHGLLQGWGGEGALSALRHHLTTFKLAAAHPHTFGWGLEHLLLLRQGQGAVAAKDPHAVHHPGWGQPCELGSCPAAALLAVFAIATDAIIGSIFAVPTCCAWFIVVIS
jgi:hypothetical protein